MDKVKTAGVYMFCNNVTGEKYIGSSTFLESRRRSHFSDLKRGVHRNPKLQASYNQYGKGAFKFILLEYCKVDTLLEREQYWLDTLQPEFNVNKQAGQVIEDYLWTEEARRKRTESYKVNHAAGKHKKREWTPLRGPDHPNYGKHLTDDQKRRISEKLTGDKNPGWGKRRPRELVEQIAESRSLTYDGLVSPEGVVYAPIKNMSKFCREHGLNVSHAVAVMHDKLKHHKGWTKYIPESE